MHEANGPTGNGGRRYETRDVTARSMVYSALGLVVLTAVGLAASWLVMKYFVTVQELGPPASPFDNARTVPPAPRLQISPAESLKAFEEQENSKLSSYGWVDKDAGIVRIPIERAMALSLQKGFPVRTTQTSQGSSGRNPREGPVVTSSSEQMQGK